MKTWWEHNGNFMGTHWKQQNNPTPPLSQENNVGTLDACYLTSLVARIFFLAYLYSFPFLELNVLQEDEPQVYVHMFEILGKDEDKSAILT
jgi:hypothetical protein